MRDLTNYPITCAEHDDARARLDRYDLYPGTISPETVDILRWKVRTYTGPTCRLCDRARGVVELSTGWACTLCGDSYANR